MATIFTITFSPCVDKNFSAPELIPSKKIYCSTPHFSAGGGGINVARALRRMGGNATAIFPSGGATGQMLENLLTSDHVPNIAVRTVNETRQNIMVADKKNLQQYQFIMPAPELSGKEYTAILAALERVEEKIDYIVVSGSMPAHFPGGTFSRISQLAAQKNARLIVDTSGTPLTDALAAGVYMVKPNLSELQKLSGRPDLSGKEIEEAAKWIIARYGCGMVVVSLGKEGAMLVTSDHTSLFGIPEIKARSTAGAGDSMVAGIIHFLSLQRSLEESVKFGVACGTAATFHEGTELCHMADAESLYKQVMQFNA